MDFFYIIFNLFKVKSKVVRLTRYKTFIKQNFKINNMTRSILHAVICGVIVGALAFFMPHLLIGLFIFCFIVRAFHCCGHGHRHQRIFYMADKIRKMNDEEYAEFKANMGGGCCNHGHHRHGHCCGGSMSEDKECCKSKKDETTK
jgi:hypothetical protein